METVPFILQRIDHVKILVPDRLEAAQWYQRVFGLKPLQGKVFDMAAASPDGPLFLGVDDDLQSVKVVLLVGEPLGKHTPISVTRVSFGVDAASFLLLLDRLADLELVNEKDERVTRDLIVDQWIGWSIYFSDPYGNRFEVTTYDYAAVKSQLNAAKA